MSGEHRPWWFAELPFRRLVEVPMAGDPDSSAADRLATLRPALLPALAGAYAAGRPVAVAWARTAAGGPIQVVAGGDLAAPGAGYPPGTRGEAAAGLGPALAAALPAWLRCAGRYDPLAGPDGGETDPPERLGILEDFVTHLAGEPFCWLVLAQPVARDRVEESLVDLHHRMARLLDRQRVSGRDQIDLERARGRYRELAQAPAAGLWDVHVLAGGTDETAVRRAAGLLCASADLLGLPYTLHPGDQAASLADVWSGADPGGPDCADGSDGASGAPEAPGAPGTSPFRASSTLVAAIARPPVRELPGVRLVEPPRFDVTPETTGEIPLGTVLDGAMRPAGTFTVSTRTLNRHAFVAGSTGAGKSQTVRHLLEGLHRAGVGWLVIEPAKAEYARMAGRLGHGAQVVTIRPGDPDTVPVSLNPLEPAPGFPLQTHLDLVRALFLAAFEAHEPFPQVLARALTRCYEDLGWDLALGTSRHPAAVPRHPTLGDLQQVAQRVVDEVGYGAELTSDVRGFIDVRIGSLRLGAPGRLFEGGHPLDMADLLRRNVVLELEDVGNDQDKAFCIGAFLIRLVEHLRVAHVPGPERLRHVTVVEEAHRLLSARAAQSPAAHAVELFAALLAEVRAYGEGVVVAEQIPAKLLPDVIKNSALKVLHRLPAADDRETVGATMNLSDQQSRHVVTLPPGEAAVFADGMDRPVLVRVPLGEDRERALPGAAAPAVSGRRGPACGAACHARPCRVREIAAAGVLAADPRFVLWIELLTVAHLTGERRPRPDTRTRDEWARAGTRLAQCAAAQLAERAVESRYAQLAAWYQPETLARHVAERAALLLTGDTAWCEPTGEPGFQAGRYRLAGLAGTLGGSDHRRAAIRDDPSRRLPGRPLLFGTAHPSAIDVAVDARSDARDPLRRLREATDFLDTPTHHAWRHLRAGAAAGGTAGSVVR